MISPGTGYRLHKLAITCIVLIQSLSIWGCVTPAKDAASPRTTATAQENLSQKHEIPKQAEIEPATTKPDTLAAVEEFLSRTQDYRLSPKPAPAAPVVSALPPSGTSLGTAPTMPKRGPAPDDREAVYANSQLSVGEPAPLPAPPQSVPAIESISIRQPQQAAAKTPEAGLVRSANTPVQTQAAVADDAAQSLIASLQDQHKLKRDALTEWRLQLLLSALDRENDIASLSDGAEGKGALPAELRNFLTAVKEALKEPETKSEPALEQLDALRNKLAARGGPRVNHVTLCRRVLTFGSYEETPLDDFVSGRTIQTIVYAEIDNLQAAADPGLPFQTKLATRIEILTKDGKSMWQKEEPEVVDQCRSRRRDFFIAQRVNLPATLPAGEYVLKFAVEDKISGMLAEGSMRFELVSPLSVAKKP